MVISRSPLAGSMAARLTLWFTLSSFVLLAANAALAYWGFAAAMEREDDEHLFDRVETVRAALRQRSDGGEVLAEKLLGSTESGRFTDFVVRVLDADGRAVLESPGMERELPAAAFGQPTPVAARRVGVEIETQTGECFRAVAVEAPAEGRFDRPYVVQVAMNRTYETALMARQRTYLAAFLLISLALCAFAGWRIARRNLRPIDRMMATARHIGSRTLDERMDVASMPIELSELAATFNDMLNRLQDSFRRLSQFSSSIAHELRTPVNNLRGEVEVALGKARSEADYRETLASVLEESQRLGRLIDSLLFLARAEDPQAAVERRPIDVAAELTRLADFYEAAATDAKVKLEVDCAAGLTMLGDATLLQRAIANLIANALDHTPAGGLIALSARPTETGIEIAVTDNGCGIPPEAMPYVFDRFFRVDQARVAGFGRTGLGLSLVRSIAQLHGGSAAIASESGRGVRVALHFPTLQSPDRPAGK